MYLRTTTRKNKDGSVVKYYHLAHNIRDKEKGFSKAELVYSFGREDEIDVEAIKRLIKSLTRFLSPEDALEVQAKARGISGEIAFIESRPMGGAYVLRKVWERLEIRRALDRAARKRGFTSPVEGAIFAAVANRALAPSSKLAVEEWVKNDVALGNDEEIQVQHIYRAMDFLLECEESIQEEVFFSTANLLNLEVDLLFFDTTSTYFEMDDEDGEDDLRRYGNSKDKRRDLPQIVIGLAVTKEGIPVRSWVFPGNTADATTVERVQKDLSGWRLGRCVWAMDRGMTSDENRKILQRGGGHYILGEKLRDGQKEHKEALSRRGKYHQVAENLFAKEVKVVEGSREHRFVIAYNPKEAEKDRHTRERTLARLEEALKELGDLEGKPHKKAVCALVSHQTMGRFLRHLKSGALKIDKAKVKSEEKLDGKYLLSSSDPSLSVDEIVLGYKQLLEVERAFRTLKTTLELRPLYHQKDERIKSHVTLCWLALLLVRVIENITGETWDNVRRTLDRIHLGKFRTKKCIILQRTELTQDQSKLLKTLKIQPPPLIEKINTPS